MTQAIEALSPIELVRPIWQAGLPPAERAVAYLARAAEQAVVEYDGLDRVSRPTAALFVLGVFAVAGDERITQPVGLKQTRAANRALEHASTMVRGAGNQPLAVGSMDWGQHKRVAWAQMYFKARSRAVAGPANYVAILDDIATGNIIIRSTNLAMMRAKAPTAGLVDLTLNDAISNVSHAVMLAPLIEQSPKQ